MTFRRIVIIVFCFCAMLTSSVLLLAQIPTPPSELPSAETIRRDALQGNYKIEQEMRQFRQQPSTIAISSPQLPPDIEAQPDEKSFNLRGVIFDNPPRSISQRELDAIASRYISEEPVSLRDLYIMLAEIDQLFDKRGVLGRAVLPVQQVQDGIVHVQIIEGRFGGYSLTFKRQPYFPEWTTKKLVNIDRPAGEHFVKKQFRFWPGSVANTKNLEEEVLRFNRTYRTRLEVELEPGNELGQSNLKLTAVAPQPVSGGYYCDNSGRESSGRIRNGGYVHLQNIIGFIGEESFYCSYDATDGTSNLVMSGDMAVSRFGTFLEMSYDEGTPKTIYGPFADLNITGMSRRYRPAIRQLLCNTKERKTDFSFQAEDFNSNSCFDGFINYREQVSSYTLGITDMYRTQKSVRFVSFNWQIGRAGVGSNPIFDDFTYRHYHLLQGGITKVYYPSKHWTFLAKSNAQWALAQLSQSRHFQIGGMATVRGTPEGLMTGDSGYLMTLEARRRLIDKKKYTIEAFGFFDHGGVFNRVLPVGERPTDFLFSIGSGLNMSLGRHITGTLGYGQPIFTAESHRVQYREKLNHGNGYFTLRAQF